MTTCRVANRDESLKVGDRLLAEVTKGVSEKLGGDRTGAQFLLNGFPGFGQDLLVFCCERLTLGRPAIRAILGVEIQECAKTFPQKLLNRCFLI